MGKVISRAPILPRISKETDKQAFRRLVRTDDPKRGRGRPKGSSNTADPTDKFIMTLGHEDFTLISRLAGDRGVTVQQYIRVFIVAAWKAGAE